MNCFISQSHIENITAVDNNLIEKGEEKMDRNQNELGKANQRKESSIFMIQSKSDNYFQRT